MKRLNRQPGGKRENRSAGQALLELMIVLALLVVILTALVALAVVSLSIAQRSRLRAKATSIAESGLENIRRQRDLAVAQDNWDQFRDDCNAQKESWAWDGVDTTDFNAMVICATPTPSGNRVVVGAQVEWAFGGDNFNVELNTELGPRGEGIYR